jgi:hypothetical protein
MEASAHNARLPRVALGLPSALPQNSCPEMGILDYASLEGNKYLKA